MLIETAIADIEAAGSIDALRTTLQRVCEEYGFAAFNFLDIGAPHVDKPFFIGTMTSEFASDYFGNSLIHFDPCITRARRHNLPFTWSDVSFPPYAGARKSGAELTAEIASDHGYRQGLIVPFRFADRLGRSYASLVVFFWRDRASEFDASVQARRNELHIIMLYWAQRAVDLLARAQSRTDFRPQESAGEALTDREREVLAWASRGKTSADTGDIIGVCEGTVNTHLRNALQKLGASNKPHGVARAIFLGLIDG